LAGIPAVIFDRQLPTADCRAIDETQDARAHPAPVPILDLPQFAAALPPSGALIGIDPGEKRIGISVSDTTRLIASSLDTITRVKFAADADAILKLYDARRCAGFVVGLPLNMDGSSGPAAQSARAFARNLLARRDAPLLLWDERLSTAAVTRTLIEGDASRRRRGEVVDKMAAAYMLQGALDAMKERE
jgi:putative Holliday junction resolvase